MTPSLHLTTITLRVSDLARAADFYTRQLGFVLVAQAPRRAELATSTGGTPLLQLVEERDAVRPPPDAAGLFHAALLFPSRAALGHWLRFAANAGVEFDGFSDHGVSEAIYFTDPEGNGLEFYADRPRAAWPYENGELAMTTRPLDMPSLLAAGASQSGPPLEGAAWGHLHLRVTDLDRSEAFYRAELGLAVSQGTYPGARFLAADGYHHHLGLNSWGRPRRPQPANALGLAEAVFARTAEDRARPLTDPDGIALRVVPRT
jgi:catechol 2,3-dioxygenase